MEQAPLISIIMPVYNAGVLLHTAVESVLRQSFADFELLLVDDGSTDGSAALAHELAKKDGRIRVLEQPNAGICAARNLGLQHCRGQWFTFCDDDDTMEVLPCRSRCSYTICGVYAAESACWNTAALKAKSSSPLRQVSSKRRWPSRFVQYIAFQTNCGPLCCKNCR